MPTRITLRQTHSNYAFTSHDEKSALFSGNAYPQLCPAKNKKSGLLIGIILLFLIILTSVLTYAFVV